MNRKRDKARKQSPHDWLTGGGEMGKLIREMDWSQTPLGPIESWPQSLKTAVRIMLTSRQPFWLGWGEQLIKLYNDPYKAIVGGKHPAALGQPAAVVWSEIWDQIGPMLETAMGGVEGTYVEEQFLVMERHGYREETYYTFSYSPIPNDEGGVGGIICANTDDTAKVLGRRRLKTLRDLGVRALTEARTAEDAVRAAAVTLEENPNDIPFALIYLLADDGRTSWLAETVRIEKGSAAAPDEIELNSEGDVWRFRHVLETGQSQTIENLAEKFGHLNAGEWVSDTIKKAVVLPLAKAGIQEFPAGFLVAGISPRLALNDDYRSFLELAAGHIAMAVASARAHEEERKRAEALAEIDRAKTAFFSNVSHEFRTPLTLMLGPLEDALAEGGLPLPTREHLEVAHRNSIRLLKLVNTLLDFARIEAGRIEAVYEPTDLAALTVDLASVFRSAVEKAGMKLIVDCRPLEEPVYVDREMWEKIVLNLLSNAFKFTFEGEIEVRLRIEEGRGSRGAGDRRGKKSTSRNPQSAILTVRDTGTGIPAEELPRLFERFHRVKGARGRTFEGSGIGLALVQELVKLHGGGVRVTSEVDRGSAFTVTIPLGKSHLPPDRIGAARSLVSTGLRGEAYVEEALRWLPANAECEMRIAESFVSTDCQSTQHEERIANPQSATRIPHSRILLADDNADLREYTRRLLGRLYEVEAVGDGLAALNLARERAPDLVLTDVMMPGLDGFGLLRELRADERLKTVPVILISARAGEESVASGLQAGADDYLVKPFSARELLARVDAALKLARVRREAQERIVGIWESITDGFIAFDRDWRYIYINAAAESIGLRRSELLGRTIWEVFPDLLGTEFETQFRRAAADRTPMEFEYCHQPWGRWFNSKVFPAADGGVTVYLRDVTDRKLAEEERARLLESERAARRQAEEASRLKDEFLATLSHELRTPLNSISGWAGLLRAKTFTDDQAERALETIERSARSQNQLINDLLDVSRIITGKMRLDVEPVRLSSVIDAAVESVRPSAEAKEIRLSAQLDPTADMVSGDAERLQQVVWNLLSNAIKFTQKGGRVQVRLERVDSHIKLTVADNGQGINPEFLPHVFDRFRQEEGGIGRQHGGLGLGLAIVRHLVELHGGTVHADSAGGYQGATFTITLPVIPVRTAGPNGKREEGYDLAAPLKKTPSISGARVLLVDDDADGRELVETMLAQGDVETRTAGSAAAALAMLDEWRPDALISDIGMPGEDGYMLIEKLRKRERERGERRLPAIALTAYARVEDRMRALSAGYQAHLSKPVEMSELLTVVASLLNRSDS
jgi:PAS domain S-box-containing protein